MKNTNMKGGLSVKKRLAASGLSVCLAVSSLPIAVDADDPKEHDVPEMKAVNEISYKETLADTQNPYRGFYQAIEINYTRDKNNCTAQKEKLDDIDAYAKDYKLLHFWINLSDFSEQDMKGSNATKHTSNAYIDSSTDDVEEALTQLFEKLRANGQTAVIRFSYDYDYAGVTKDGTDDDGNYQYRTVWEPTDDAYIFQHQEKVGAVVSKYTDVIGAVECGIIGPWGEMHSSDRANKTSVKKFVAKWLAVLPEDMTVNVRTPTQFCYYSDVKLDSIDRYISAEGTDEYRVGLYNDGYLGSSSDLGTFENRDKEIKWLTSQTAHTLYGGELCAWDNNDKSAHLNNIAFLEKEAFKTHTAYLNVAWNDKVINSFKSTKYSGTDTDYNGKTTEFEYLRNHLGYRFVVRDVKMTTELSPAENFALDTTVENVGFGNLIIDEKTSVIIKGNDLEKEFKLWDLNASNGEKAQNYDATKWYSGTSVTSRDNNVMHAELDLPDDMPEGEYKVYIKIANRDSGEGEYPIRFSNEGSNVYDSTLGANFVGTVNVTEYKVRPSDSSKAESSDSSGAEASNSGSEPDSLHDIYEPDSLPDRSRPYNKPDSQNDIYEPDSLPDSRLETDSSGIEPDVDVLIGDVDGNGKVNAVDITKTAAHIKGLKHLDSYAKKRADVDRSGRINAGDISKIAAHIKGLKRLS